MPSPKSKPRSRPAVPLSLPLTPTLGALPPVRTGGAAAPAQIDGRRIHHIGDANQREAYLTLHGLGRYDTGSGDRRYYQAFHEWYAFKRRTRLGEPTWLVAEWFFTSVRLENGNLATGVTQTRIAREVGKISQPCVCKALAKLIRHEVLLRGELGEFYINPRYHFCGDSEKQRGAAVDWDKMLADERRKAMETVPSATVGAAARATASPSTTQGAH